MLWFLIHGYASGIGIITATLCTFLRLAVSVTIGGEIEMSYQVPEPYLVRNSEGEPDFINPKMGCEDCGTVLTFPARYHRVGRRNVCCACWSQERTAPSVQHFRIGHHG